MPRTLRVRTVVALAAVSLLALTATTLRAQEASASHQVGFSDQIKAMLDGDHTSPPPRGGILFIGSSIFRQWTNVKEHMAPLPVFNRAFGGSRTWEVLHYMDQIVVPYQPRVIVYYTGSNDVNAGEPASAIVGRTKEFIARAHAALPATRIYYLAITRSPDKRDKWSVVDAVNTQMHAMATATPFVRYIDLNPVLFANGEPRMELYRPDGLHFYPPAYDLFTAIIKPVLTDAWQELAHPAAAGQALPAVDVPSAAVKAFIDKLPKDRISDLPIRVAEVGGYKVGVYGVFRPKAMPGGAIRHDTSVTEVYYMLEGSATLVTGGRIVDEKSTGVSPNTKRPNFGGGRIEGGVTRHMVPGDIVIIPGNAPHWWSVLDSDIRYLIVRPDPEGLQPVK